MAYHIEYKPEGEGTESRTFGIKEALLEIEQNGFSDRLLDEMIALYREICPDMADTEQLYDDAMVQLPGILGDELQKLDQLYRNEAKIALKIAFYKGECACQQNCYVPRKSVHYDTLVVRYFASVDGMQQYPDYYQARIAATTLAGDLEEACDPFSREHVISIECAWDERCFAMLRLGFRLGVCKERPGDAEAADSGWMAVGRRDSAVYPATRECRRGRRRKESAISCFDSHMK